MSSSGSGPTSRNSTKAAARRCPAPIPPHRPAATIGNGEEALDIEYVHAMAPKANIILYEANSDSEQRSLCRRHRRQEQSGCLGRYHELERHPNRAAIFPTILCSRRREPPYGQHDQRDNVLCHRRATRATSIKVPAKAPADFPPTSPNVVAVGGTSLYLNTNNSYSSETAWSWNSTYHWGGGGGTSTVQAKPSYQTSYGTAHPGNILANDHFPRRSRRCDGRRSRYGRLHLRSRQRRLVQVGVGGTSLASPLFAGLVADADEHPFHRRLRHPGRSRADAPGLV